MSGLSSMRVRFPRLERRGAMWGRSWTQLMTASVPLFVMLFAFMFEAFGVLGVVLIPGLLTMVVALTNWRRESVMVWAMHFWRFWRCRAQRQWYTDGIPEVMKIGELELPGMLAPLSIHETSNELGFVYDPHRKRFSITFRFDAPAWELTDDPQRERSVAGFAGFLNGLGRVPGLVLVDLRARRDPSDSSEAVTYMQHRMGVGEDEVLSWSQQQAVAAARDMQLVAMDTSYEATFTLSAASLRDQRFQQRMDRIGGDLQSAGQVLELEADSIKKSLTSAGVHNVRVLDATGLRLAIRRGFDPFTVSDRLRAGEPVSRVSAKQYVRPLRLEAHSDHVRADGAWHQGFLVMEWPLSDVGMGFLTDLVDDHGSYTRCFTLQIEPIDKDRARRQVEKALTDLDTAEALRTKMGNRTTRAQRKEADEVADREEALTEGHREMSYRGFVVTSARSREGLDEARVAVEVAATEANLEVRLFHACQAQVLITAVLPVGAGRWKR
ncbi:MAG: hypothetical protein B5766_07720 [Candidatus Lumbricidophila eiseniae]|uniref:PrgI family protein n=1 Tax=Candidatus Lumbricidiphila eiseniae TaxID=1969409 RepID=A0A2A6FRG4_9MICO|nr:MAG: hypothetical protein B5766_07720 [Candidatus Lumbricidophila eiseniae]